MSISFNYWMVIVPVLYALGLGVGYWLVWPGKTKALRRPFHWKSNLPIAAIILSYSIMSGTIFMVMLYVESLYGIMEVLGRDTVTAILLAPLATVVCGGLLAFATIYGMLEARKWHARRLKRHWIKWRGRAIIDVARAEANKDTHAGAGLGMTIQEDDHKVIFLNPQSWRRRRRICQIVREAKRKIAISFGWTRNRFRHASMTLPEDTVRKYRHQNQGQRLG